MPEDIETNKAVRVSNMHGWSKHTPIHAEQRSDRAQYIFRFANGYGASLINGVGSYGNEIDIIKFIGPEYHDWDFAHDDETGLETNHGILGWLTPQQIEDTLDAIKALTAKEITA